MKQTAINVCKTEEEKSSIKDMTLEKLEDFGLLCKIEVLSPGMLYGGLDILTAKHGKSTCSNEAIAGATI